MIQLIQQTIFAALGSVGFGVLFGVKKRNCFYIFGASTCTWLGYQMCICLIKNETVSLFAITFLVVLFSEVWSIYAKGIASIYVTPILIPLIPGATLYRLMKEMVAGADTWQTNLWLLAHQAGAMALGIILSEIIVLSLYSKWRIE